MKKDSRYVNTVTKLSYGVGNAGYGVVSQTMNNFIFAFGSIALGMQGTLVSIAIALSVLWDALSDPIVGTWSDKVRSKKFGRRHGFMLFGCIGMAVFNIVLWGLPVALPEAIQFGWLLLALLTMETFNTTFVTPYVALGTEMSDDYNERTSIQAYKTVFFLIGMIIPTLLAAVFMSGNGGYNNPTNYLYLALCTSGICLFCGLTSVIGTRKLIPRLNERIKNQPVKTSDKMIFAEFFSIFKKPNFRAVIIGYALSLVSAAFLTGIGIHVFSYTFHMEHNQVTGLLGCLLGSAVLSQPFWYQISKKWNKVKALKTGLWISLTGLAFVTALFVCRGMLDNTTMFILLAFSIFLSGFGTGALYSLPISMYADLIGEERERTGFDRSGTYNAFLTFAYKIANAIALVIIGVSLDIMGFNSEGGTQPASVQMWLGIVLISGIFLSLVISLIFYARYKYKPEPKIEEQSLKQLKQEIKEQSVELEAIQQQEHPVINIDAIDIEKIQEQRKHEKEQKEQQETAKQEQQKEQQSKENSEQENKKTDTKTDK